MAACRIVKRRILSSELEGPIKAFPLASPSLVINLKFVRRLAIFNRVAPVLPHRYRYFRAANPFSRIDSHRKREQLIQRVEVSMGFIS